jgi:IS1 family transposase
MSSFVSYNGNKLWKELAIDALTKEILGLQIGSRVEPGARDLWDSLAAVYRQPVVSYTDFEAASKKVFPRQRHKSVGKDRGPTSDI